MRGRRLCASRRTAEPDIGRSAKSASALCKLRNTFQATSALSPTSPLVRRRTANSAINWLLSSPHAADDTHASSIPVARGTKPSACAGSASSKVVASGEVVPASPLA